MSRLLVITQKIDADDAVLGFMHRWLEVLSGRIGDIHALCLFKGRVELPNVTASSLGKERGANRRMQLTRFYGTIITWWKSYDTVLVHMNQVYVLLAAPFWRLSGKRVFMWRNHAHGTWMTRIAVAFCNGVFYTSPQSYTAKFPHAHRMPVGIDTDLFSPDGTVAAPKSILVLGRLDPIKRLDVIASALCKLHAKSVGFSVTFVGEPSLGSERYAGGIRETLRTCGVDAHWTGAVVQTEAAKQMRRHAVLVNATPSGSMDKTILEALAVGCGVVCCNAAMSGILPPELLFRDGDADDLALRLERALQNGVFTTISTKLRDRVVAEHSLTALMMKLIPVLEHR